MDAAALLALIGEGPAADAQPDAQLQVWPRALCRTRRWRERMGRGAPQAPVR